MTDSDNLWSFSLRSSLACEDDEDETDNEAPKAGDASSFLVEVDLSARHETVDYRPNPFSIARINAAQRQLTHKDRKEQRLHTIPAIASTSNSRAVASADVKETGNVRTGCAPFPALG